MPIPLRRSNPEDIVAAVRTFFVTSSIMGKRQMLQSHRSAGLFVDVLYHYRSQRKYLLHAFVVMPDHFHLLITLGPDVSIEQATQFVKGGFAFRAGKELEFKSPVWERGFSEVRIYDAQHFSRVSRYIVDNPVRRRLVENASDYPYSSAHVGLEIDAKPHGLKPAA
jgi:putative transposase